MLGVVCEAGNVSGCGECMMSVLQPPAKPGAVQAKLEATGASSPLPQPGALLPRDGELVARASDAAVSDPWHGVVSKAGNVSGCTECLVGVLQPTVKAGAVASKA